MIYNSKKIFTIRSLQSPMMVILILMLFVSVFHSACTNSENDKKTSIHNQKNGKDSIIIEKDTLSIVNSPEEDEKKEKPMCDLEQLILETGMVNVLDIDPTLQVNLKYSTTDNVVGLDMYGDLVNAYLQPQVAEKLAKAHGFLKDTFPEYRLIIYDAARPKSIQKMMWDSILMPVNLKAKYLSSPKTGSLHNYGAAVDISIVDENGNELDMGTPFDSFDELAQPILESKYLQLGLITPEQVNNRALLKYVMKKGGFFGISTEWWHFSVCNLETAQKWFKSIDNHIIEKNVSEEEDIKEEKKEEIKKKNDLEKQSNTDKISYRVQIHVTGEKKEKNHPFFQGLTVQMYQQDGLFKYTAGTFENIEEARAFKNKLQDKFGFTDSFVVAFLKNKRVALKN